MYEVREKNNNGGSSISHKLLSDGVSCDHKVLIFVELTMNVAACTYFSNVINLQIHQAVLICQVSVLLRCIRDAQKRESNIRLCSPSATLAFPSE